GNSTKTNGGGIFVGGTLNLSNSTVANNTADSDNSGSGVAAGNGGGVYMKANQTPTPHLRNSLIAHNIDASTTTKHPDCSTPSTPNVTSLTSQDYNLIENTTGCTISGTTTHDLHVDPALGSLMNNGGPTMTQALLPSSVALNNGNPAIPTGTGVTC